MKRKKDYNIFVTYKLYVSAKLGPSSGISYLHL